MNSIAMIGKNHMGFFYIIRNSKEEATEKVGKRGIFHDTKIIEFVDLPDEKNCSKEWENAVSTLEKRVNKMNGR